MSTAAASTTPAVADVPAYCKQLAQRAQAARFKLAAAPGTTRANALRAIARRLLEASQTIQQANAKDLANGQQTGLSAAMLDRLKIDDAGVKKIANSVEQIADQTDPLGQTIEGRVLPNGIRLQKRRVPLGVVLIIFESRPNVTSDAAALCIKSGNAAILRGGKEAIHSNHAIAHCVKQGLEDAGLDPHCVQLVETTDRAAVGELLKMEGQVDIAIPRGGQSLIRAVVEQARIPVIKHYTGNCHMYVDAAADEQMAIDLCVNAKTQRTGVCNATETFLFHEKLLETGLVSRICRALADKGVQIHGDERICAAFDGATPATDEDWATEYLDLIVAAKVVANIDEAMDHINRYGSRHTDAIVTSRLDTADRFVEGVDTANAFVNCSTRFSDGGEYGLGAEIGISTDKLHARGPMGAADLTTYQWVAYGNGQVRN